MCSKEVHECTDIFYNHYIPSKVGDATILMEDLEPGKIYVCAFCNQKITDLYREQYSKRYSSLRATYTVSGAFSEVGCQIDRCFQTGYLDSEGSMEWLEQIEKDERIVKALEKNNVEDTEHKLAIEMVQRCKELGELVSEWPSKKENVEYFIASMKNMVAILELLGASEDDVSRIKESFCENNHVTGWHSPSKISHVNLM